MRLIDADILPRHGNRGGLVHWKDIEDAPTVDIVRCRDCRHWDANDSMGAFCWCDFSEDRRAPEDFCSYGEVKHETD